MGHTTDMLILCAYCENEADVLVVFDIGTRYLCHEHHKAIDPYWPFEQLNQAEEMSTATTTTTGDGEDAEPKLQLKDKSEGENYPFFAPVLVTQKTAKRLLDLMATNRIPPEDSLPVENLYHQLVKAYDRTKFLDDVNHITPTSTGTP